MKRLLLCIMMLGILCGCKQNDEWSDVLKIRNQMLQSQGCTFDAGITADYGDVIHNFKMRCSTNRKEAVEFEVLAPETIAGITGSISGSGGNLTFDDTMLVFELLAEGRLSPVCAPWVIIHALRGGYIKSYVQEETGMKLQINDSYEEDALALDIQFNSQSIPVFAEIYWQGKRILTVVIENFCYL